MSPNPKQLAARALAVAFAVVMAGATGAQEAPSSAPAVTVAVAKEQEIVAVVPVSGTVDPLNEIYVTPQVSGVQIVQVLVDVGDWVERDYVLIKLRRDVYEAEQLRAKAEVARSKSAIRQAQNQIASTQAAAEQAETELARYTRLLDSGSTTEAAYDQVVANTEAARAALATAKDGLAISEAAQVQAETQYEIAQLNLGWTEIKAPVTGIVGKRDAKVGSLTSMAAGPLLTIFENGSLELTAEVIETALGEIAVGDGGTIDVAGVGPLIAGVRLVAPTVDQTTRLGEVKITLESDPKLRAGLFGSGNIETDRRTAVTVPITAVLSDDAGTYVQVVKDGTVARRDIVAGLVWQGSREVVSGLEDGETVIARAGAFFRDGDHVRIVEPGGAGQ